MTLTPPRFHIADDMPMSLGNAIAREIAPKVDRIEVFNKGQHSHIAFNSATKTCLLTPISEKDCRQIKGAASKDTVMGSAVASGAAPPSVQKFRVGDRVRPTYDCASWDEMIVTRVDVGPFGGYRCWGRLTGEDHEYWVSEGSLELISPASETETEGWVTWNGAFSPPASIVVGTKYMLNWRGEGIDGMVRTMHNPAHCDWTDCIAYKVIA